MVKKGAEMSRVNGSILLVGSVVGDTAEDVMKICGGELGDKLTSLPDGETGFRRAWISFLAAKTYEPCPELESVERPKPVDPSSPDEWRTPDMDWVPQGPADHWQFRVKDGVKKLRFEQLGYAEEARTSYGTFCELRDSGVIPAQLRFQVSIPLTESGVRMFFMRSPESLPIVWEAYEEAMKRELLRLCEYIPPSDLAVQWDIAVEVIAVERDGEQIEPSEAPDGHPFDRYAAALGELSPYVDGDALLGLHLCYGDLGHRHFIQPKDLGTVTRMANAGVAAAGRRVDWMHMPVPRDRHDDDYFAPLSELAIGDTKPFIGLVHHTDGLDGTLRRLETAKRHLNGFGISTECGWGRRAPDTLPELMRIHREAADRL